MSQLGFFDVANRYAGLDAKNDPLLKIDSVVPWEDFRPHLEAVWRKPANQRKTTEAGDFPPTSSALKTNGRGLNPKSRVASL